MATKKSAKKSAPKSSIPADRYTIMQVAQTLKCRYQRARDFMLQGLFGETQYEGADRKLTVSRDRVLEHKKQQDEKSNPTSA